MVNFFSNFASVVANIVGITFAFLISKVLNNEKEQKDTFGLIEKELVKLKKIKKEIEIIEINDNCYDSRKKNLLAKYREQIERNEVNDKDFFVDYGCFYLNLEEILEDFKSVKIKIFEEKNNEIIYEIEKLQSQKLFEILSNNKIESHFKFFSRLPILSQYGIYEKILNKVNEEELNKIETDSFDENKLIDFGQKDILDGIVEQFKKKAKYNKILPTNKFFSNFFNGSFQNSNFQRSYEAPINALAIQTHKVINQNLLDIIHKKEVEIKKLLLELEVCESSLEKNIEELGVMKDDEIKLKKYLIFILIFFLLGVVYPLSFTKYKEDILVSNGEILNYNIFTNFWTELFSMSGLFLSVLTVFIGFILCYIWKETAIRQKSKEIINKIEKEKENVKSDWVIKRYYEFEELKNIAR